MIYFPTCPYGVNPYSPQEATGTILNNLDTHKGGDMPNPRTERVLVKLWLLPHYLNGRQFYPGGCG
jgi:hypothetical protein